MAPSLTLEELIQDIRTLVDPKGPTPCGPIMVRLCWHDCGVYAKKPGLTGGCPNAAMRHTDGGEGTFGANAGLTDVAQNLLKVLYAKYVPHFIGYADLWCLAANIAIEMYGGPSIKNFYGRADAKSPKDGVESQVGRLPDGDKGAVHLRDIFWAKGFSDKDIVALSGAHTLGHCHGDRSGFEGPWTAKPLSFDNQYFVDMLSDDWKPMITKQGNPQFWNEKKQTMMLISDLALIQDPGFKPYVELYAKDQTAFFRDFADAWSRLQCLGCNPDGLTEDWPSKNAKL